MKTKMALAAVGGLAVGIVSMWFLVARTTGRVFDTQYLTAVMDQANVALHIRSGKEKELLATIETSLPDYVLAVHEEFRDHSMATNALWMVKAYYTRNDLEIPAEIRGILESLPPKPPSFCAIRLKALDGDSTDAKEVPAQK